MNDLARVSCINPDFIAALRNETSLLQRGALDAAGQVNKYGSGEYIPAFTGSQNCGAPPLQPPASLQPAGSGALAGQWLVRIDAFPSKESFEGQHCWTTVYNPDGHEYSGGVLTVTPTGNASWKCQRNCGPTGESWITSAFSFFDGDKASDPGPLPPGEQVVHFEKSGLGKYSASRARTNILTDSRQAGQVTEKDEYSIVIDGELLQGQRITSVVSGSVHGHDTFYRNPDFSYTCIPGPQRYETFRGQRMAP